MPGLIETAEEDPSNSMPNGHGMGGHDSEDSQMHLESQPGRNGAQGFVCIGCLVVMANWVQGDGQILPCSVVSGPGGERKCLRCQHHSKPCHGSGAFTKEQGEEFCAFIANVPLDHVEVKRRQEPMRLLVRSELLIGSNSSGIISSRDEANRDLLQVMRDTMVSIHAAVDTWEGGNSCPVDMLRHAAKAFSDLADAVHMFVEEKDGRPFEDATSTAERLGAI